MAKEHLGHQWYIKKANIDIGAAEVSGEQWGWSKAA